MSEWWTYSLSDFLMFSPQAYWRLIARANAGWWPAQLAGSAASLALPLLLRASRERTVLAVLALAWAWVGWAFHWQRYAEIFLGAPVVAIACGGQAALLLAAAALPLREPRPPARWRRTAATALLLVALLYPLLAPLTGRDWPEAEVFGFLPEPTAVGTLGALLAMARQPHWRLAVLAVIPGAALLLGAATRWLIA